MIKEESTGLIVTKNHDKATTMVSLVDRDDNKAASGGKLIFHKYGSQYFLSEFSVSGRTERPSSRFEDREEGSAAASNCSPERRDFHCCPLTE
jgi:hypothetical protein